ncbi:MAG TPA: phosphatase PAP2 family protein [Candidatus Saccharimonadales bacterium]|nr:phosphatase PAP2 family protein [Candidatus Saccharimonadales bacterium]
MLTVFFRLNRRLSIEYVVSFILACLLGFLGIKLASSLFYDPRPFVSTGIAPLFAHAADNGFPSDHTTFSIIMAAVTLFYSRRIGMVMMVIAGMIGSARVFAHVHSWVDIIGGIVVGIIVSVIAVLFGRYLTQLAFSRRG